MSLKQGLSGIWFCFVFVCFGQSSPISPATDFYSHVNGEWMETEEIPEQYGSWGSFHEVLIENQNKLKSIFQNLVSGNRFSKGSNEQLVRDFYRSGMDTLRIESMASQPLQPFLEQLDGIQTLEQYLELISKWYLMGIQAPIGMAVTADEKNSTRYALYILQSGLGLGNRSYYLEDTPKQRQNREAYVGHIAKMLQLAGVPPQAAQKSAERILEMETLMARAHRTPVQGRDAERNYNRRTFGDLEKMTFNIDWRRYIGSLGVAESVDYAIVMQPEFIAIVDRMFEDYPLQYWKEYSRWKLLQFSAPYLSRAFRDQHFDFYQKTLFGTPKQQPRWKIVQNVMDDQIGQPLGQLYVSEYFPPQHKERMLGLIENLRTAFDSRILRNSWMSEQTKNAARLKLKKMGVKIGYPDKWIDYSKLEVSPEDYLGNVMRSETFNNSRNFKRVGETLDPYDWGLTPPTVNAYYSATRNEIVFPAGILNPPFFYPQGDDASNYGSAGVVIGHEITHGFDDKGSLYDAEGNLKSWWTVEDREKFEALAGKIEAQFNGYTVLDTIPINGKLTLGENIGDLGGLAIAFEAMKINQRQNGSKVIDGLSDEQRFFIAYAKMWRIKYRDAVLTEQVKVDPHAPGYYRANGTLSNFQEFFRAFKIPEGSAMRRKEVIEIW